MVNDTISDMLTRIRNANLASKNCVAIPKTKIHINIAKILEQEGFIESFSMPESEDREFNVNLKYLSWLLNGCRILIFILLLYHSSFSGILFLPHL